MKYQFTDGAARAMAHATVWRGRDDHVGLEAPGLLLGLLAEAECRAAIVLGQHGIDAAAVGDRWPALRGNAPPATPEKPPDRFTAEVAESLHAAATRLAHWRQPTLLGTEHLLLGLVAADHDTARWLRQRGLDADLLERQIQQREGYQPDATPLEFPDEAEATTATNAEGDGPIFASAKIATVSVLRVLDAAANRAAEGIRVLEDYVRFVLDDRHLTELCKCLRHDLAATLAALPLAARLASRETQADVGTALATPAESRRDDLSGILAANASRLQQALRSLEEFAKLAMVPRPHTLGATADLSSSAENTGGQATRGTRQFRSGSALTGSGRTASTCPGTLEKLRYRAYTLQRAIETTRTGCRRMAYARLYVLLDGRVSEQAFEQLAGELIRAGADAIQLRDKRLADGALLQRARRLRELTAQRGTLMIVNDRPDLAALAHADGVHVGQEELSVKDVRTLVGPDMLVGISTHSIEQARQAVLDGANYIGVGPTFASTTKQFETFPGVALLRAVADEIRLPAFAIGGINAGNLPEVLAAGMTRVAVASAVTDAVDPSAAVKELLAGLGGR